MSKNDFKGIYILLAFIVLAVLFKVFAYEHVLKMM